MHVRVTMTSKMRHAAMCLPAVSLTMPHCIHRLLMRLINAAPRCKAIGVSNFEERHLEHLIRNAKVRPAANQVTGRCWHHGQNARSPACNVLMLQRISLECPAIQITSTSGIAHHECTWLGEFQSLRSRISLPHADRGAPTAAAGGTPALSSDFTYSDALSICRSRCTCDCRRGSLGFGHARSRNFRKSMCRSRCTRGCCRRGCGMRAAAWASRFFSCSFLHVLCDLR